MNNKYIITGAPGTGKTSIINELISRNFSCVRENSREVISEQLLSEGDILPWKNQMSFEEKISRLRIQQYKKSLDKNLVFFDRSPFDSLAYLNLNNLKFSNNLIRSIKKCKFNKSVFFTPIWAEIYEKDKERIEDINKAKKIEEAIIKMYSNEGFNLIKVPKLKIKARTDFIISKTNYL
jgi:predicted ATPase